MKESEPDTPPPDQLAAAVAQHLYGFRPSATVAVLSENNSVFRADFGGMPPKIVKLARRVKPMLHEQAVLGLLRRPRWSLPCPNLEFTQEDLPERWEIDGRTFRRPEVVSVMTFLPGMNLRDAALRGEPWAPDAFRAAGALLARLAEIPATQLPRRRRTLSQEQIRRGIESVREVAIRRNFGETNFARWEASISAVRSRPSTGLIHGEPCARQFLVQCGRESLPRPRVSLLDWDTARPGDPLADLATLLSSFDLPPAPDPGVLAMLQRRAIDGFAATRPIVPEALAAWRIHLALHGARYFGRSDPAAAEHLVTRARAIAREFDGGRHEVERLR